MRVVINNIQKTCLTLVGFWTRFRNQDTFCLFVFSVLRPILLLFSGYWLMKSQTGAFSRATFSAETKKHTDEYIRLDLSDFLLCSTAHQCPTFTDRRVLCFQFRMFGSRLLFEKRMVWESVIFHTWVTLKVSSVYSVLWLISVTYSMLRISLFPQGVCPQSRTKALYGPLS